MVYPAKPLVFVAAQVQFISTSGELWSGLTPPEEGKELFNEVFAKSEVFSFKPKRARGRQVEIFFDPICDKEGKKLLGAKIARTKRMNYSDIENKHFVQKTISIYPFVLMLWDSNNQVLLVEQKSTVFADVTLPIQLVLLYLNSFLNTRGLIAKWEFIREKGTFWKTISDFEEIFLLKIELIGPNFLGSTCKKAGELLKLLKNETNGTEFSMEIKNENGKVKLDQEDELTQSVAEHVDLGGGNLRILGIKKEEKTRRKRKVNLKKQYKYIQLDQKFDNLDYLKPEKVTEIIEEVRIKRISRKKENG